MKAIKNAGKPAVTRTVVETITPATEATFDLIGLSESQMAIICILVGRSHGNGDGLFNLYDKVHDALDKPNMDVIKHEDILVDGRLRVDVHNVKKLLDTRK